MLIEFFIWLVLSSTSAEANLVFTVETFAIVKWLADKENTRRQSRLEAERTGGIITLSRSCDLLEQSIAFVIQHIIQRELPMFASAGLGSSYTVFM